MFPYMEVGDDDLGRQYCGRELRGARSWRFAPSARSARLALLKPIAYETARPGRNQEGAAGACPPPKR